MPTLDEDQQIIQAAANDPDALPLTEEQMKQLVSIRYSPEGLDHFRSLVLTGNHGWVMLRGSMWNDARTPMQRGLNTAMHLSGHLRITPPMDTLLLQLPATRLWPALGITLQIGHRRVA